MYCRLQRDQDGAFPRQQYRYNRHRFDKLRLCQAQFKASNSTRSILTPCLDLVNMHSRAFRTRVSDPDIRSTANTRSRHSLIRTLHNKCLNMAHILPIRTLDFSRGRCQARPIHTNTTAPRLDRPRMLGHLSTLCHRIAGCPRSRRCHPPHKDAFYPELTHRRPVRNGKATGQNARSRRLLLSLVLWIWDLQAFCRLRPRNLAPKEFQEGVDGHHCRHCVGLLSMQKTHRVVLLVAVAVEGEVEGAVAGSVHRQLLRGLEVNL